jgi:hypothetical protein
MVDDKKRYRFLLIEAFHLKATAKHATRNFLGPKEETLMNYKTLKPLLDTIEWERDPGPEASYGDWPVETREEFDIVSAARLPIVRKGHIIGGVGTSGGTSAQDGVAAAACLKALGQ